MRNITTLCAFASSFTIAIAAGGCGKQQENPTAQCEQIYQKGDGSKPYSGDKPAFIAACVKASAQTRTCLLKGDMMSDKACAPGNGTAFRESMQLMTLGQGSAAGSATPPPTAKPAAPSAALGELSIVADKNTPAVKLTPKLAIASETKSPATWQIYLVGECATLPGNPCDLLPKGAYGLDSKKLEGCAGHQSVKVTLSHQDQMKAVELKPGKFGKKTADAAGAYLSYYHDVGQSKVSVTDEDNLVELTAVDADTISGTLSAKSWTGTEISGGPFTAKICRYN